MTAATYGKWRGRSGRLSLLRAGDAIRWYAFEPVKLRLADSTFYTPDFMVVAEDGTIEFHEVKGAKRQGGRTIAVWREDARVKIKIAAEQFPMFRFVAVHELAPGRWEIEEF